jgi:acetyl esterase/lipase
MNTSFAQSTFPLYPAEIPNSKKASNEEVGEVNNDVTAIRKISIPTITYFPAKSTAGPGTAIIIFPGGGYVINSFSHEGTDVARRFNEIGVSAFVVKYRLPDDRTMINKEIGPLQDAQQAIKMVREQAWKYNINPQRIGVIGFSAGGHLASTAGTHFTRSHISNDNKTSLRPDFMILIYPVISFQNDIGHQGSKNNLIGPNPTQEKIDLFSNELQITQATPPTFLAHASDDTTVVPANSIRFYENLVKHNIPAELHIYQEGGHGFGLTNLTTADDWFRSCSNWLQSNGWIASAD